MPPSLIKLYVAASSTVSGTVSTVTTTTVSDAVTRFVAIVTAAMIAGGTTTVPDTSFVDDAGNPVPTGSLPLPSAGGYVNVYINGVLQESSLTSWTASGLSIASAAIAEGTPVVVEVHNYDGTASVSTSTPSLTVTTTTVT